MKTRGRLGFALAIAISGGGCGFGRQADRPGEMAPGIPEAAVSAAAGENLVANPGFEEADAADATRPKDWLANKEDWNKKVFWSEDRPRSGRYCGKLAGDAGSEANWSTPMIPVAGGVSYRLSFWARHPEPSAHGMIVQVYFYLEDRTTPEFEKDEPRGDWTLQVAHGGPFDWHRFSRVLSAPPEARWTQIVFRIYRTAGTVHYDDVHFGPAEKAP